MPYVGMTGNADAADFALPKAERLNDSTAGRDLGLCEWQSPSQERSLIIPQIEDKSWAAGWSGIVREAWDFTKQCRVLCRWALWGGTQRRSPANPF